MKKRYLLLVLAVLVALFTACGHGGKNDVDTSLIHNPNTAEGVDKNEKMPVISFEKDQHDFGRLSKGEMVSYSFKFRNTGNAPLIISECKASCGCTVADFPKNEIAPGGEGFVTVSFNSAQKRGQQIQTVTVGSNAQPSRHVLKITAQVEN